MGLHSVSLNSYRRDWNGRTNLKYGLEQLCDFIVLCLMLAAIVVYLKTNNPVDFNI